MIPPQMQGQVPLNYQAMMMQMPVQQPGYGMPMTGMMVPQVRPPMGMFPPQMYAGQPNSQNVLMD